MVRWQRLLLLSLLPFALGDCASTQKKPDRVRPKVAKIFHYYDTTIGFPGNGAGSTLRNIAVTVDQNPNDYNKTRWAFVLDTNNINQDVEKSFQGSIEVYFETADNAPVPSPGNGIFGIAYWRDHCYYGGQSHRVYEGTFNYPYTDFFSLADHIRVIPIYHGSRLGKC
jgi:hypothetical protein